MILMILTVIRMVVFRIKIYKNIKKLNKDNILILNRNLINLIDVKINLILVNRVYRYVFLNK